MTSEIPKFGSEAPVGVRQDGLAFLVDGYNLDPTVAEGLSDLSGLDLGLPSDADFAKKLAASLDRSLSEIRVGCEAIERGDFGRSPDLRGPRGVLGDIGTAHLLVTGILNKLDAGLTRNSEMLGLHVRAGLAFADTATISKTSGNAGTTMLSKGDLESLGFPRESRVEEPSDPIVAERLRERIASDPTVDPARFLRTADSVNQLECAASIIADVVLLGNLGPKGEKAALEGYTKRIGGLFEDDWSKKLEALEWLSDQFKAWIVPDYPGYVHAAVKIIRDRNLVLRQHIQGLHRTTYEQSVSRGIELPPSITGPEIPRVEIESKAKKDPVVASSRATAKAGEPKAPAEIESKSIPDTVTLKDLRRTATELEGNIREALGSWRMNEKQRATAGFNEMVHALVGGVTSATGDQLLARVDRSSAEEIVGVLAYLRRLATRAKGLEALDADISKRAELQRELGALRDLAVEAKLSSEVSLPRIVDIPGRLAHLMNDWGGYRQLIINTWPKGEGVQAADAIEAFLWPKLAEGEESRVLKTLTSAALELSLAEAKSQEAKPTDTKEALGALVVHEPLNITDYLDVVILPRKQGGDKVTREDLEEALDRLDAKSQGEPGEAVARIDWQRLMDLVDIGELYDGTVYRTKKGTLGDAPPYYAAVFEYEGITYAVAESPVKNSATFVVSEFVSDAPYLEVLMFHRGEIEGLEGRRIVHSAKHPHGPGHVDKILKRIDELAGIAAKSSEANS